MTAFASAIDEKSLASLEVLNLAHNHIGYEGMGAFANKLSSGSLPSLQTVVVDDGPLGTEHSQLKAACEARKISIE